MRMTAHQFCRRRPRNHHPGPLTSRRTASRRRQRSPYRQFGREKNIFRRHAAAPAPPQCRRLVLRPGGLDQPSGACSAAGDRRNGHPCRPPPNRPRPGWPALFGLSSRLPAGAEVRRPSDLHRPSVHPQGRPKQPRQTKGACGHGQGKQWRPRHKTAPAETHQRREPRESLAKADRPVPACLCCLGRSPRPPDQADHRSGAPRKPIRRLQLVVGPPVSPPETAPKTAVRLHPNHSHRAAPTPPTISVVAFGRPQTLIRSA